METDQVYDYLDLVDETSPPSPVISPPKPFNSNQRRLSASSKVAFLFNNKNKNNNNKNKNNNNKPRKKKKEKDNTPMKKIKHQNQLILDETQHDELPVKHNDSLYFELEADVTPKSTAIDGDKKRHLLEKENNVVNDNERGDDTLLVDSPSTLGAVAQWYG